MRLTKGLIGKSEPAGMGDVKRSDLKAGLGLLPTMSEGYADPHDAAIAEVLQDRSRKLAAAGQDMPNVTPQDVETEKLIMDAGQMSGGIKKTGDLAMDLASRMSRARDMGFDTNNKLYHGTEQGFDAFKPSVSGHAGPGVYLTENINAARNFGENIMPLYTRATNPLKLGQYAVEDEPAIRAVLKKLEAEQYMGNLQYEGNSYNAVVQALRRKLLKEQPQMTEEVIGHNMEKYLQDQLKKHGYDSIDFSWNDMPAKVVFDPSHIRHENAKFDPKQKKSAKIMAGIGGAALLGQDRDQ